MTYIKGKIRILLTVVALLFGGTPVVWSQSQQDWDPNNYGRRARYIDDFSAADRLMMLRLFTQISNDPYFVLGFSPQQASNRSQITDRDIIKRKAILIAYYKAQKRGSDRELRLLGNFIASEIGSGRLDPNTLEMTPKGQKYAETVRKLHSGSPNEVAEAVAKYNQLLSENYPMTESDFANLKKATPESPWSPTGKWDRKIEEVQKAANLLHDAQSREVIDYIHPGYVNWKTMTLGHAYGIMGFMAGAKVNELLWAWGSGDPRLKASATKFLLGDAAAWTSMLLFSSGSELTRTTIQAVLAKGPNSPEAKILTTQLQQNWFAKKFSFLRVLPNAQDARMLHSGLGMVGGHWFSHFLMKTGKNPFADDLGVRLRAGARAFEEQDAARRARQNIMRNLLAVNWRLGMGAKPQDKKPEVVLKLKADQARLSRELADVDRQLAQIGRDINAYRTQEIKDVALAAWSMLKFAPGEFNELVTSTKFMLATSLALHYGPVIGKWVIQKGQKTFEWVKSNRTGGQAEVTPGIASRLGDKMASGLSRGYLWATGMGRTIINKIWVPVANVEKMTAAGMLTQDPTEIFVAFPKPPSRISAQVGEALMQDARIIYRNVPGGGFQLMSTFVNALMFLNLEHLLRSSVTYGAKPLLLGLNLNNSLHEEHSFYQVWHGPQWLLGGLGFENLKRESLGSSLKDLMTLPVPDIIKKEDAPIRIKITNSFNQFRQFLEQHHTVWHDYREGVISADFNKTQAVWTEDILKKTMEFEKLKKYVLWMDLVFTEAKTKNPAMSRSNFRIGDIPDSAFEMTFYQANGADTQSLPWHPVPQTEMKSGVSSEDLRAFRLEAEPYIKEFNKISNEIKVADYLKEEYKKMRSRLRLELNGHSGDEVDKHLGVKAREAALGGRTNGILSAFVSAMNKVTVWQQPPMNLFDSHIAELKRNLTISTEAVTQMRGEFFAKWGRNLPQEVDRASEQFNKLSLDLARLPTQLAVYRKEVQYAQFAAQAAREMLPLISSLQAYVGVNLMASNDQTLMTRTVFVTLALVEKVLANLTAIERLPEQLKLMENPLFDAPSDNGGVDALKRAVDIERKIEVKVDAALKADSPTALKAAFEVKYEDLEGEPQDETLSSEETNAKTKPAAVGPQKK